MARKQIDWEAVEREYRAGLVSMREIARKYNLTAPAILKRARRDDWKRDLTARVKAAVNAKLVNDQVNVNNAQKDEEIIEAAASQATRVVLCHRNDARQQSSIIARLLGEVDRRTGDDKLDALKFDDIRITFAMLRDSSQALLKLTQIERQAYSLDSGLNAGITSVLSPDRIDKHPRENGTSS